MTIPIEIIVAIIGILGTILIGLTVFWYKLLDNNTKAITKLTTFISVLEQQFKDNESLCAVKHSNIDKDIAEFKEFCKTCKKK